jgi:hypothetical protein
VSVEHFFDPRLPARFWSKVRYDTESGCWIWIASTNGTGYGQLSTSRHTVFRGNPTTAHRFAYFALVGDVPWDRELDHRCRTPLCCNPAHLEAVTHQINMSRGHFGSLTHCRHGHPFSGDNLKITKWGRRCRTCIKHRNDARGSHV